MKTGQGRGSRPRHLSRSRRDLTGLLAVERYCELLGLGHGKLQETAEFIRIQLPTDLSLQSANWAPCCRLLSRFSKELLELFDLGT